MALPSVSMTLPLVCLQARDFGGRALGGRDTLAPGGWGAGAHAKPGAAGEEAGDVDG